MSRQTTVGRFGFEKSISFRTSVMETKVTEARFIRRISAVSNIRQQIMR